MILKYPNKKECERTPFEWLMSPKYSDILSYRGRFDSLNCYKVLML